MGLIDQDLTPSERMTIAQLRLDVADYLGTEQLIRSIEPGDPAYGASLLLLVDLLFANNRFEDLRAFSKLPMTGTISDEEHELLELWRLFIRCFGELPNLEGPAWRRLESRLVDMEHSHFRSVRARAHELSARLSSIRFTLRGGGQSQKLDLIKRYEEASSRFAATDRPREALRCLIKVADLESKPPQPDSWAAISRLETIASHARAASLPHLEAEASLMIASLTFKMDHQAPQDPDLGKLQALFQHAEDLFNALGHRTGPASVVAGFAKSLLEHGYLPGVELAEKILPLLETNRDLSSAQSILSDLHQWHVRHGNADKALEVLGEKNRIEEQLALEFTKRTSALAEADQSMRYGRIANALNYLSDGGANPDKLHADDSNSGAWLMRSNTLRRAGRIREAYDVLQDVIPRMESTENPFWGQALNLAANLLGELGDKDAIPYFLASATVYEARGENMEVAQQYNQLASTLVQWRKKRGQKPVITEEIETHFNLASKILQFNRTLAGRIELAMLATNRGQAAFFEGLYDACGFWYEQAESIYRILELKHELAFIKTHEALVLIDRARQTGVAANDKAYGYLLEALNLFQASGMREQTWNSHFYLGLCQYEASRWEIPNSEESLSRLELAKKHLEDACNEADRLRGASTDLGPVDSQYRARSASGLGKVELYRTGLRLALDGMKDPAYALQWLERMKSRALLDAVDSGPITLSEELRDNPNVKYDLFLREELSHSTSRSATLNIEKEIESNLDLLSQNTLTRRYVAFRRNDVPTFEEIRDGLTRNGASRSLVISYFTADSAVLVFGVRSDWEVPRFRRLNIDPKSVHRISNAMRREGGPLDILRDHSERPWQLLNGLVEPIADWCNPGEHVCLIPFGDLHGMPLHTLSIGLPRQRIIWRNPISYSPSLSVLHRLLLRPASSGNSRFEKLIAFGDSLEDRSAAARESRWIAETCGGRVFVGPSVTRDVVLSAMREASWVHFAGHGEASRDDGLGSSLILAGGHRLTARELMVERIAPKVVVLSGCETGAATLEAGDEAVGLPLALLHSGASTLISSQWRVGDSSSEAFMVAFYESLLKLPSVSTLSAWYSAVRKISQDERWANPYYWGPFVLSGDWR